MAEIIYFPGMTIDQMSSFIEEHGDIAVYKTPTQGFYLKQHFDYNALIGDVLTSKGIEVKDD